MLCAFQLEAASMDPVVPPGSIVVIATEDKDPERLVDVIVAAREWNALKLFWLQKHKHTYKLVPERVSSENPVWDVQSSGDHSIVGRVIRWIASPPEKQPQASSVFSMFRRR